MSPRRASRAREAPGAGTAAPPALDAETLELVAGARRLEKHPLGRLISLVEQEGDRARAQRIALFRHLGGAAGAARVIGITGTPGSGKSTLIGAVCLELVRQDAALRVAVVAVDPSSTRSGGAFLGDRLRTHFPVGERRLFFRSQATRGDLGGMGRRTFVVTRLLRHFFDLVLVETVGIGQSEIDVSRLSDLTVLVLQPLGGDHIQFMKAGIMEVPDAVVVNKADEEILAERSWHELLAALDYVRVERPAGLIEPHVFRTSARSAQGVTELAAWLREEARRPPAAGAERERTLFFLRKTVAEHYGRFGLEHLDGVLGEGAGGRSYEELEDEALRGLRALVR